MKPGRAITVKPAGLKKAFALLCAEDDTLAALFEGYTITAIRFRENKGEAGYVVKGTCRATKSQRTVKVGWR